MNKQTLDEINAETITSQDFDNVCKLIDWLTQKSDTPNTGDHVAATMNGPYYREEKQIPFARFYRKPKTIFKPFSDEADEAGVIGVKLAEYSGPDAGRGMDEMMGWQIGQNLAFCTGGSNYSYGGEDTPQYIRNGSRAVWYYTDTAQDRWKSLRFYAMQPSWTVKLLHDV